MSIQAIKDTHKHTNVTKNWLESLCNAGGWSGFSNYTPDGEIICEAFSSAGANLLVAEDEKAGNPVASLC